MFSNLIRSVSLLDPQISDVVIVDFEDSEDFGDVVVKDSFEVFDFMFQLAVLLL